MLKKNQKVRYQSAFGVKEGLVAIDSPENHQMVYVDFKSKTEAVFARAVFVEKDKLTIIK